MKKIGLTILLPVLIAGCAMPPSRQETYDLIKSEMSKAAAGNVKAAEPETVSASLLPALNSDLPPVRKPLEERFNLSFSNAPASQFFMGIVAGTPYNMLVHPEVTGNISANLKDVTLFEALDAIRELYGYEYRVEGTRIYVKPLTLQTRVFQINYLASIRKGSSDIRVTSGSVADALVPSNSGANSQTTPQNAPSPSSNGGAVQASTSSKINTSSNNDFWAELKASLDILAGGGQDGRQVVINPQSGVVVVRAMSDEIRNIAAYLKATQLSVDRQVILEAKILEVELNDQYQTGINWASFASLKSSPDSASSFGFLTPGTTLSTTRQITDGSGISGITGLNLGASARAAGSLFGLAFQTANFTALLSFLESQGSVHVLSSPRIATLNNQKAVLKVGKDEFFVTSLKTTPGVTSTAGNTAPTVSVEVQPFFSGVALDVTPQIDEAGNIILHVHPSVSKVSTIEKTINAGSAGSVVLPLASSVVSETDSIVRGQNGRIVAIGGLMRQSNADDRSQVPGVGEVPVLGGLFRNTNQVSQKRELVILIRPTIVENDASWEKDLLESQKRIEEMTPRSRLEKKNQ
ncbi:pilus (MSHA type) biogenesis protein MshL [Undibacterium fentianense]|uniref:Pilus (MSHA type) biogenesis protein MshL n=1 Tax=Undibacterium fentianense TaxID=2828728 RepID=A0A941E5G8_9BURK|nr:pilus (MSHA type) biogenesis protein MshL [Undibacterium fentianense]MBR7800068.1 pilus (MSHA type) biogenesis protein MshL [Undibacterium fentianense]